jgi:hypothetical protein
MDLNKTVDFIIRDLEEAREIIDDLKNYRDVPAIQIEMAKSKIRNAAEVISLFKSMKPEAGSLTPEALPIAIGSLTPSSDEKEQERSVINISESGIVADRFNDLHDSLNEAIGLDNLSKAIGINDRFLFIRELFDGNSESYNQAISKIDEAQSFSDARALMITFAGDKSESEAGKQLLDLVKRKFPGNE